MGSAVGFRTISLTIKHAWGESFITQRNKANPASPRVSPLHGKSLFPWQPNWLSLSKEWGRRRWQAGRGSGGMTVHADLHLTSRCVRHIAFLLSRRETLNGYFQTKQRISVQNSFWCKVLLCHTGKNVSVQNNIHIYTVKRPNVLWQPEEGHGLSLLQC